MNPTELDMALLSLCFAVALGAIYGLAALQEHIRPGSAKKAEDADRLIHPCPTGRDGLTPPAFELIFEHEAEYRIRTGQRVYLKPIYAIADYPGEDTFVGFDFYKLKEVKK